jgi:hypothetical protein
VAVQKRKLSIAAIESSKEMKLWLEQFAPENQTAAKLLLMHLRFIPRDAYSNWLLHTLESLAVNDRCAAYSVRKLHKSQQCLWDSSGHIVRRPGASQGS